MPKKPASPLITVPLGLAILLTLGSLSAVLFNAAFSTNYFAWFIAHGPFIALATAVVMGSTGGLKAQLGLDLIALNPLRYFNAHVLVLASFFDSIATFTKPESVLKRVLKSLEGNHERRSVSSLLDRWLCLVMLIILCVIAICWLLFVVPANYFVIVFAGSVARQASSRAHHLVVTEEKDAKEDDQIIFSEVNTDIRALPKGGMDISIGQHPFELTQALSAVVLWGGTWIATKA